MNHRPSQLPDFGKHAFSSYTVHKAGYSIDLLRGAFCERRCQGCCCLGFHRVDPGPRLACSNRRRDSYGEPSSAERDNYRVHIWQVLQNLQTYRPVACDHSLVAKGMNKDTPIECRIVVADDYFPDLVKGD